MAILLFFTRFIYELQYDCHCTIWKCQYLTILRFVTYKCMNFLKNSLHNMTELRGLKYGLISLWLNWKWYNSDAAPSLCQFTKKSRQVLVGCSAVSANSNGIYCYQNKANDAIDHFSFSWYDEFVHIFLWWNKIHHFLLSVHYRRATLAVLL